MKDLRAAEQHCILVASVNIEVLRPIEHLNRLFQERGRFARQHGFVDDTCTMNEEDIGRNGRLCLLAGWIKCNLARSAIPSIDDELTDGDEITR